MNFSSYLEKIKVLSEGTALPVKPVKQPEVRDKAAIGTLGKLNAICTKQSGDSLKFQDGSETRCDPYTAQAILNVHAGLGPEMQEKLHLMANKSQEHFKRLAAFAHGAHTEGLVKPAKPLKPTPEKPKQKPAGKKK